MRSLRQILLAVAVLSFTALGVIGASANSPAAQEAKIKKFAFQAGESARSAVQEFEAQIKRPVKQPKTVPFQVKANLAATQELPGGRKVLQIDYLGERDWITVQVIPAEVQWIADNEEYKIVDVTLSTGVPAQYMDNGAVQMLLWRDGDLTYHLAVGGSKRPVDDILKIAESFAN